MLHLGLIVYAKMTPKLSVYFVTCVFSFEYCFNKTVAKIKRDTTILMHLASRSGAVFLYFDNFYSLMFVIYLSFVVLYCRVAYQQERKCV